MSLYPQVKLASQDSAHGRLFNHFFDRFCAPLLRLRKFQMAYARARVEDSSEDLWTRVLKQFGTRFAISESDLQRIPKTGPALIVANHPHGIMDGVILGSLMHQVRNDFKIIMNEATSMPGLENGLLFVSIFSSAQGNAKKNAQVMRQAMEWLKKGHALVVYPAGEISAISQINDPIALDNTWNNTLIRLALRANAPVLPLFIVGQNDALFLKLGLIHPVFRTMQIGRVTNQLIGQAIEVRAAHGLTPKTFATIPEEEARADFIRSQVYCLLPRETKKPREFATTLAQVEKSDYDTRDLQAAFDALTAHPCFSVRENNTYKVLLFNRQQLIDLNPTYSAIFACLKDEIGRLRELTFRTVGEGSGLARDLDQFDDFQSHLTLWDVNLKQLIGAYRLGFTQDLLPKYGIQGLYTASQYDYSPEFFTHIGQAMEVSRAFIIPEQQKSHSGLSMLLGAIAQIMIEANAYTFFGAVSISNEFQTLSKKLIINFLDKYYQQTELTPWVKAKNPPQLALQLPEVEWQRLQSHVTDLSLLNTAVTNIEVDSKQIPSLIPIYTALSGRFVTFDHDVAFNSIDGLLVINLQESARQNPTLVKRLMGKDNFEKLTQRSKD